MITYFNPATLKPVAFDYNSGNEDVSEYLKLNMYNITLLPALMSSDSPLNRLEQLLMKGVRAHINFLIDSNTSIESSSNISLPQEITANYIQFMKASQQYLRS